MTMFVHARHRPTAIRSESLPLVSIPDEQEIDITDQYSDIKLATYGRAGPLRRSFTLPSPTPVCASDFGHDDDDDVTTGSPTSCGCSDDQLGESLDLEEGEEEDWCASSSSFGASSSHDSLTGEESELDRRSFPGCASNSVEGVSFINDISSNKLDINDVYTTPPTWSTVPGGRDAFAQSHWDDDNSSMDSDEEVFIYTSTEPARCPSPYLSTFDEIWEDSNNSMSFGADVLETFCDNFWALRSNMKFPPRTNDTRLAHIVFGTFAKPHAEESPPLSIEAISFMYDERPHGLDNFGLGYGSDDDENDLHGEYDPFQNQSELDEPPTSDSDPPLFPTLNIPMIIITPPPLDTAPFPWDYAPCTPPQDEMGGYQLVVRGPDVPLLNPALLLDSKLGEFGFAWFWCMRTQRWIVARQWDEEDVEDGLINRGWYVEERCGMWRMVRPSI